MITGLPGIPSEILIQWIFPPPHCLATCGFRRVKVHVSHAWTTVVFYWQVFPSQITEDHDSRVPDSGGITLRRGIPDMRRRPVYDIILAADDLVPNRQRPPATTTLTQLWLQCHMNHLTLCNTLHYTYMYQTHVPYIKKSMTMLVANIVSKVVRQK